MLFSLIGSIGQATTITYESDILIGIEFAGRVLTGIDFGDPRTAEEQGFVAQTNVTLQATFDDVLAPDSQYDTVSFMGATGLTNLDVQLLVDGIAPASGVSLRDPSWFYLATNSIGEIESWYISYYFG